MAEPTEIVEGWTSKLIFTLKSDGVAVDLTGTTPAFVFNDANGAAKTPGGTTAIEDAVNGKVSYSPVVADFLASESVYAARFKVTDGASKISYYPGGDAIEIRVRLPK